MALSIATWHFYLQITKSRNRKYAEINHFAKSVFNEVIGAW